MRPRLRATAIASQYSIVSRIVEGKDQFSLFVDDFPAQGKEGAAQRLPDHPSTPPRRSGYLRFLAAIK
jgi:hypothetical protein